LRPKGCASCGKAWLVPVLAFSGIWRASTAIAKQQLKPANYRNRSGAFFVARCGNRQQSALLREF
jgi:hypothetical protein